MTLGLVTNEEESLTPPQESPAASPVKEPSVVVTLRACPAPSPPRPWPSPGAVRHGADSRPGQLVPLPGPCRLLALCAMVRGLGKGHGDAHPFMPQHGTDASLSPAAGTSCAAACIATFSHGPTVKVETEATKKATQTCLNFGGGGGSDGVYDANVCP